MNKKGLERRSISLFFLVFSIILCTGFSSAWFLNGTVYDSDGNVLTNANISVTAGYFPGGTAPTYPFANSTNSSGAGTFMLNVSDNSSCSYQIKIIHRNATSGAVDFVGQTLPYFPYQELRNNLTNVNMYLRDAGTINVTAINSSGGRVTFNYQLKDTSLGYTIDSQWASRVSEANIYIPRDRNYSIMIYPDQSMPISFDWSNFSAAASYTLPGGISTYNVTTKVVQKQFNTTMSIVRVSGYVNNTAISGWNEFTIVPYLLEPGNMVMISSAGYGTMPFNMSAWNGQTDVYDYTTGYYNISLPGPAETQGIMLFAAGKNNTDYYGSYKNVSVSYGSASSQNFTMYRMLGETLANITMFSASDFNTNKKVPIKKQTFNLVNATDSALLTLGLEAHVEVEVDYSAYGANAFTFMVDASGGSTGFAVPLLNVTGAKEINVFTQSFAPRSIDEKSAAQILSNPNLSLSIFNPQTIGENAGRSNLFIGIMKSNSSCNVPNPNTNCYIIDPSNMNMESFSPLSAVIGGGKINFVMGMSGVKIMYINVDMLASGPPDVSFENQNNVNESRTSSGFGKIMRFGSKGPKIYDYVLVSMPYNEANVKENAPVNLSIPVFYDENWNPIWNSSSNGTSVANFAGNYSHYSTKQTEWDVLMNQTVCTRGTLTNSAQINASRPCYIDITKNKIWVRLPHFSGSGPQVNGLSSSDRYTTNGVGIDFLSTTSSAGSYSAIKELYINVTSNITDFKNITVFIYYNASASNANPVLNVTYWNATEPSLFINYSNLNDGIWYFNATVRNDTFANYTVLVNITVDTTYPLVSFNDSRTDIPYSNFSRNWAFMNINVTEINEANVTFTLYNTTGAVNVTTFTDGTTRSINWTGLANGVYTYNATVVDRANNRNTTSTRTITLDTTGPAITVYSPANNSLNYNQTTIINFIASDALGFATTRWYNYNSTTNNTFGGAVAVNLTYFGNNTLIFYANDTLGNLRTLVYVVNVTALNTNTTFVANSTTYVADANKTSIIVPYNTSLAMVNLTNLSQQFSVDLTQLLINGQSGVAAIGSNSNITLSASDNSGNYTVVIPSGINITGGSNWDGKVALPNLNTSTQFSAPGSGGSIVVIEVGSSGELNFTSSIKIIFGGQAGKKAAWSRGTPTLTNITTICNSGNSTNTTSPGNIDATTTRECYINDGSDLNVWTYHFTTFATFTPPAATVATTTTTTTDSSSGSGTYVPSFWTGTYIYNDQELSEKPSLVKEMAVKERVTIKVGGSQHEVGVVALTATTATINVSSTPQQAILVIGESKKFDVDNNGYYDVKVTLNGITNNKASLTITSINEKVTTTVAGTSPTGTTPGSETTAGETSTPIKQTDEKTEESTSWYLWVILIVVVIVLIVVIMRSRAKNRRYSGR